MRNGLPTRGPDVAHKESDDGLVAGGACDERPAMGAGSPPHCSVPLTTPRLSGDQASLLSAVFKALGHPTRVQVMNLLVNSQFAVCAYDLQTAMGLAQSTLSHHMKQLVAAGLVSRQQRGIWAYYSIDRAAMRALGVVIDLDDATPQPFAPAALRDPAMESADAFS